MDNYTQLYTCKKCSIPIMISEGFCFTCMPEQEPHRKRWAGAAVAENLKSLRYPKCTLCKGPRYDHKADCLWKPRNLVTFGKKIKKERNPITRYKWSCGHEDRSNLPKDEAICPFCMEKNVIWVGDSYTPEPIFGARPF